VNDPVRLVDGPNEDAAALLEAWSGERPSHEARRRAMALAAGVGASAAALGAATGAGAVGTKAAIATTASKLALAKWVVVGALAATAAAGAGVLAMRARPSSEPAAPVATAIAPAETIAPAAQPPVAPAIPVLTPNELPTAKAEARETSATSATSTARVVDPRASSVARELDIVDRARAAVRAGDGEGALALLDAFDAEFPKSSLADEVVVIRVDALAKTGRTDRAAELARAFVARKPASPYAARLRAVGERRGTNP